MRPGYLLAAIAIVIAFSCNKKKDKTELPVPPSAPDPVLLKDITVPNLPSPHYHFEYDNTGKMSFASHASGFRMYNIFHDGNILSEMRNNTMVNHDTVRYFYNAGKASVIQYISEDNIVTKRVFLTYIGDKLQEVEWERNVPGTGFIVDRTMTFTYLADGNVSQLTDHSPAILGQPEINNITRFEQYDTKICPDDFMLLHEGGNPHMILLPGIKLQKNNPGKLIRTGTGVNYTVDYSYTYNNRNVPLTKSGDLVWTSGPNAGQHFQTNAMLTYY